MNHALASAITAEYAPTLIIDPFNSAAPRLLQVRKTKNGAPFSIHLSDALPDSFVDIPGHEAIPEQPAIEATADHPGAPAIPAQPAVMARTKAGQEAESERAMLIAALDAAKAALGA